MSLSDDLQVLREGAAFGVVAPTRQIAVTGTDRAAYLHGLLTNDIKSLTAGSGCYAAWLTPQGRMQTDMHVFELGDMLLLDVPADQAGPTLERLDECIFAEDVRVESLDGAFAALWIHGPAAPTTLESALGAPGVLKNLAEYRALRVPFDGTEALIVRVDQLGVPGLGTYVRPGESQTLRDALRNAGAVDVAPEAIDAARIEARYPRFGMDMTADTIPLEAGIEGRAISFTKGCYVGQEVIVRVLHRGQGRVAKRLVGLRFEAPAAATRTARLLSNGREIGFVTSAAQSPAGGSTGMGYVHRDFVEAGTVLQAHGEGGDAARTTVTGLAGHPESSAS